MTPQAKPQTTTHTIADHGFTLIELVAVMVIVSVLAATAAPALLRISNTRSVTAVKHLLHDLTLARQRAVATGTRTWVVFDLAGESWSLLSENPASPGRAGATVMTDVAAGRPFTQTLDSGSYVDVEILAANFDGDVEVGFDWLGQPLDATGNPPWGNRVCHINRESCSECRGANRSHHICSALAAVTRRRRHRNCWDTSWLYAGRNNRRHGCVGGGCSADDVVNPQCSRLPGRSRANLARTLAGCRKA